MSITSIQPTTFRKFFVRLRISLPVYDSFGNIGESQKEFLRIPMCFAAGAREDAERGGNLLPFLLWHKQHHQCASLTSQLRQPTEIKNIPLAISPLK